MKRNFGRPRKQSPDPTLSDFGITKHESSDWQALATLSDEEYAAFRAEIATGKRGVESRAIRAGHAAKKGR